MKQSIKNLLSEMTAQEIIDNLLSEDIVNLIKYQAAWDIVNSSQSCYWDSEDIINVAEDLFNKDKGEQ